MKADVKIFERTAKSKGENNRLRREQKIPIIIYSEGKPGKVASCDKVAIEAVLRGLKPGFLPTTVFHLKDASGKTIKAIVKDIQYNVVSYNVMHIDFLELKDDRKVEVKVPVECVGTVDCVGVKAGGFVRQISRFVEVRCLPKDIPASFEVDVRNLNIFDSMRVKDLNLDKKLVALAQPKDVIVSVVK
jgi:large subunit ribosomal protein L25